MHVRSQDGPYEFDTQILPGQLTLAYPDEMKRRGFGSLDAMLFHGIACRADALVIAESRKSTSTMSADREVIFTRTRFALREILHAKEIETVDHTFFIIREGGEIQLSGKKYVITDRERTAFRPGESYLLILLKDETGDKLFSAMGRTFRLKNDRIFPDTGAWLTISPGTPVAQLKEQVRQIMSVHECQ